MKQPRIPTMKMPQPPPGRALQAGLKVLAQFAHHAPATFKPAERMARPGKPHGPRN